MFSSLINDLKKSYVAFIAMLVWFVWVILEYFPKHPLYAKAFTSNSVFLSLGVFVLIALVTLYLRYLSRNSFISVIKLLFCFVFLHWTCYILSAVLTDFNGFSLFGLILFVLNQLKYYLLIILLGSSYLVAGQLLKGLIAPLRNIQYSHVEFILIGMAMSTFFYFILLSFGLFTWPVLLVLTVLPLALGYKHTLALRKSYSKPFDELQGMQWYGYVILALILGFLAITFMHVNTVMPRGYDALNYYINLPNLLSDNGGRFVEGFQPYNLSIIQSLGKLFSGGISGIMAISWSGLPLLILSMWVFGRQILNIRKEYVLFAICAFVSLPAVTTQATHELKIDLMFTSILVVMLTMLFRVLNKNRDEGKTSTQELIWTAIMLGLLGGFALGVKLTAIVVVASLIILIWAFYHGLYGGLFVFCFSVAAFLLIGLDDTSGLGSYHTSDKIMSILFLLGGIFSLVMAVRKSRQHLAKSLISSALIAVLTIAGFSPWVYKNYRDTGKVEFDKLLNGKKPGPELHIKWPKKKK